MKPIKYILIFSIFLLTGSCITQFIPETNEVQDLLVVEGLITDQPGICTIKLSRSVPLGERITSKPLKGCTVSLSDDLGNTYSLKEKAPGNYETNPAEFQGIVGRKYKLNINTNSVSSNVNLFESMPMEMKPVPPIDSLYYEKITTKQREDLTPLQQGAQVYLNTYDPGGICKFFRWDFTETWEFRLPYEVRNSICWISSKSSFINIKNTSVLTEDRIFRHPVNFISTQTDRLNVKYSIQVRQYSLNEDEFDYWKKLQNISEEVGGLYDITPSTIPGNVFCLDDPNEPVLGYFSVSAIASKRIFIEEFFAGLKSMYTKCATDTIYNNIPIPDLNSKVWVIVDEKYAKPPYKVITTYRDCGDCTFRGTNIEPLFWRDDKKQ